MKHGTSAAPVIRARWKGPRGNGRRRAEELEPGTAIVEVAVTLHRHDAALAQGAQDRQTGQGLPRLDGDLLDAARWRSVRRAFSTSVKASGT